MECGGVNLFPGVNVNDLASMPKSSILRYFFFWGVSILFWLVAAWGLKGNNCFPYTPTLMTYFPFYFLLNHFHTYCNLPSHLFHSFPPFYPSPLFPPFPPLSTPSFSFFLFTPFFLPPSFSFLPLLLHFHFSTSSFTHSNSRSKVASHHGFDFLSPAHQWWTPSHVPAGCWCVFCGWMSI